MPVWIAYWGVVLIWATTPIGIAASNDSLHFLAAGGLRMLLAALVLVCLCVLLKRPILFSREAVISYAVASFGLFPNMALVYWGAQYVPSGVVSIIFALNPVAVGLFSWVILSDNPFTPLRVLALSVSVAGMGVIYLDQLSLGASSGMGILALLCSVCGWSLSTVYLVKLNIKMDPMGQAAGMTIFAIPGYALSWFFLDGTLPEAISVKSLIGVGYLAIFGSVVAFTFYFYILSRVPVMTVSLITLMSPVLALMIGVLFAGEVMTKQLLIGVAMVLVSLLIYQLAPFLKKLRRKKPV